MSKNYSVEDQSLSRLIDTLKKRNSKVNLDRVRCAFDFAKKAHEGQFRMSGAPYICHPAEAANILAELSLDEDTIIAGLLHDVPEDTDMNVDDVERTFGKKVARLVDAVTKLSKVYYKYSMDARQIHSLRKMFIETANDPRVIIVKLADRLHNMRTLQYLRPDKQQRIAKETLEIYAPLANLYGIYQLRRELEDLCFMYLQPEEYSRIESFIHDNEKKRMHFVNDTIEVLKKSMKKSGIKASFQGRPKHFYSIYQKMIRGKKVLQDIHDYFAIRVILGNEGDCYTAIGVVHDTFKPKLGRFKDYIALPKANGYQSLHTTVVGLRGKLTEIQVRTENMHKEAEFGAAAHLTYKDGKMSYLSEHINELKKYENPESFIRGLQEDLLQDRIYVFSPTGKIINLPTGATVLDYVYSVNLPVDTNVFRAIVNNKSYSLTGELQSGDHVEIVYGKKAQNEPQRWWLNHVKTSKAKKAIKEHYGRKSMKTKLEIGEKLFQQELDHENQSLIYHLPISKIKSAMNIFGVDSFDKILVMIGDGTFSANEVYNKMFPDLQLGPIAGVGKLAHKIVKKYSKSSNEEYKYRIRILIEAYDRVGLTTEVVQPFYELKIPILKFIGTGYDTKEELPDAHEGPWAPVNKEYISKDIVDIYIEDHEQLIALFDRIEKIPGLIRVKRVFQSHQISFLFLLLLTTTYVIFHPFALKFLLESGFHESQLLFNSIIYIGLFGVFGLLALLRSMGNKTFPHFEETKFFWPMSMGLTILLIATLFVDNAVFELNLHLPVAMFFSFIILIFLYISFRSHQKRRMRHLNRLKETRGVARKKTLARK